jgi:uncharacterized protein YlxP (DUF503 family)
MHIGVMHITLRLPENHSLKGKRQVVKSVVARLHNQFNVSAAEVDELDVWQIAGIGVCCVSNSAAHADQMLASVIEFIERTRPDLELVDYETEVISGP